MRQTNVCINRKFKFYENFKANANSCTCNKSRSVMQIKRNQQGRKTNSQRALQTSLMEGQVHERQSLKEEKRTASSIFIKGNNIL